jgi:hypothetical protein|tara:strand:- start:2181 stop:2315 length:135 start_codon:yes stop_codon:yes gene_type:complete
LNWFTIAFGQKELDKLTKQAKRTFWKLSFLCEDRLEEEKEDADV